MNGYELQDKLRKVRRLFKVTDTAQALYYELGAINNEWRWKEVFECKNATLTEALNITENTLIRARLCLVEAGLLYYAKTIGRGARCRYSFTTELEVIASDFEPIPEINTVSNTAKIAAIDLNTVNNTSIIEPLNTNTAENTSGNTAINTSKNDALYIKGKQQSLNPSESISLTPAHEEISHGGIGWNSKPKASDVPDPPDDILQAVCEAQVLGGKPLVQNSDVLAYWKIWKKGEVQGDKFYPGPQEVYRYFVNHCRGKTIAPAAKQSQSTFTPTDKDSF